MIAIIPTLTILYCLSAAFAQPPKLRSLSLSAPNPNSIANTSDAKTPKPLTADTVQCLKNHRPPYLIRRDCRYVLDEILLRQPNVVRPRSFKHNSYQTDSGTYARSRWRHRTCEVEVYGNGQARQVMSFLDIATVAGQISEKCVNKFVIPLGGVCPIGDERNGFHVILQGIPKSLSAKSSSLLQSPAVSVSKRAIRSQSNLEKSVGSQGVEPGVNQETYL